MKKSAVAIIENAQGNILLQQRDGSSSFTAYRWGLFGGEVLEGHAPQQVILLKLQEELGIKQEYLVQVDEQPVQINSLVQGEEQWVFLVKVNILDVSLFKLTEGLDLRFFSADEIFSVNLDFAFNTKDILLRYLRTREKVV
jgi:ADP-ribose pyrophosphatase YjhB (NUDIX family)